MEDPTPEKVVCKLANGSLQDAVRALEICTALVPTGRDFHFYSNFQEFKGPVAKLQSRVASLLSELGSFKEICSRPSVFPSDPDEAYEWLVGVQDDVLERVDASLDRFELERKDHHKRKAEVDASGDRKLSKVVSPKPVGEDVKIEDVKVARNKDRSLTRGPIPFHIPSIPRPQDKFDELVDNSNTPFKHRVPVGRVQQESQTNCLQDDQHTNQTAILHPSGSSPIALALDENSTMPGLDRSAKDVHPLEEELSKMVYAESLLDAVEIRKYRSLDDTPLTFVTTVHALKEMARKLQKAGEIAVDLENHHYRSFQGFVCLMQVSTRYEDFVVDTIDLRSQIGPCLGAIFSDPTIRKVMHGSDRDVVWLQRDFGIYVCNLFDTGQATRVLKMPGFGLAFLLEHFCGVHSDKRYQLADWRIRPLPSEMLKYAREDTHYLLYVHDMLKKQLLASRVDGTVDEEDPCLQVYRRSRDICLQLYSKDIFTETSFEQLYGLQEKNFRPDQLAVLAALYAWRDHVARKEDESTGYVLPNHLLFQLASEMPDTVLKLQSFVKGSHSFVGHHARTVVEIISRAKEKSKVSDSQSEHEEHKHRRDSQNGKLSGDLLQEQRVSIIATSTKSQIEELTSETDLQSSIVQPRNLVSQSKSSTTVVEILLEEDIFGLRATASCSADVVGHQIVADAVSEAGQVVVNSATAPPVVVSRRTSSSFFNTKPRKISTMPALSSLPSVVHEGIEISKASNPPTVCLGVPAGHTIPTSDVKTPEASAVEQRMVSLGERPTSNVKRGRMLSDNSQATKSETTSSQVDTDTEVFSPNDMTVINPDNSTGNQENEANTSKLDTGTIFVSKSTIRGPDEYQKDIKPAQVVLSKRSPSKLGALLGGRSRSKHGTVEAFNVFEQVQARSKVQDIASSLVLPFGCPAEVSPIVSQVHAQHPETGVFHAINTIEDEKWDEFPDSRRKDNGRPVKDGIPENHVNYIAPQSQDVVMLEGDSQEAFPKTQTGRSIGDSPRIEDLKTSKIHQRWWPKAAADPRMGYSISSPAEPYETTSGLVLEINCDEVLPNRETGKIMDDCPASEDLENPKMHRKWWPHIATDPTMRDASSSPCEYDEGGLDQVLPASGKNGTSDLPLSISETHKNFRRAKRNRKRNKPKPSNAVDNRGVLERESAGNKKREREKSLPTEDDVKGKRQGSNDSKVAFRSFNYREARNAFGLEDLYSTAEPRQVASNSGRGRGRGRGSRKGANNHASPLNKSVFDPLRRAREQPRPEGIQPGQRRQVFPQTGNRTAVFRQ